MKSKKYKQGLVTSLTALSTAMLCQTATTYASDIEIYKAPTMGGATLMLVLDMSSSMQTPVKGKSGGYQNPINADFGISCSTDSSGGATVEARTYERVVDRVFVTSAPTPVIYTYQISGRYCNVKKVTVDSLSDANKKALIINSCELFTDSSINYYRCPDRLTSLKHSLFDLIIGSAINERLPSTASIGFRTFPTYIKQAPLVLTDQNRATLLTAIAGLNTANNTPISKAYATGAGDLFGHISTSEAACAGYGVYFLTDGEPVSDDQSAARTLINPYLKTKITSCSGSWQCVAAFAEPLQQKKNTENVEVKTAIVGFGKDFSFTDKSDSSQNVEYVAKQLGTYTDAWLEGKFKGNALEAAKAAVRGQGGWYSANSKADIVSSVDNFVNSIKVPIPAITTGTSAIPQDVLNTSVIQPYAYFPQFQPKPSEEFRTWAGNLKKYKVDEGLLKDKNNTALFSSAGVLNTTNEDLWTPNYATGTTLTADQQSLKALGGLLSRLNLKKTGSNLNRKVFTSDGTTLTAVDEAYIKGAPAARGYYLGLLGYNVTTAQVAGLTTAQSVETLMASAPELRQVGAVMHSTPVLLTQSGKITFVPAQAAKEAVPATATEPAQPAVAARAAYNDTTNRDDYILFGTTQGVLHVVKAGKSDEITTVGNTAGEEVFAFVPQEMLAAQGKAFLDPQQTVIEGSTTNGMNNLYYGVDGVWTARTEYVYDTANETFKVYDSATKYGKQWVYGGLRMGGRSYYALDLTKMAEATDNQPRIKFRINPVTSSVDGFATPSDQTTRYANLAKMGQSWSKPTIANVQWKGKRRLVMFVGGGYDSGYETFNYDQTNGVGAGVYMFDANTGEFLWSTYDAKAAVGAATTYIGHGDELKYSVVSQIKGVDRDGDGDVDHLYFGDLGGQVFRVDLNSTHSASGTAANYAKQITRIYNGHVANGVSPRFYEMPAFTVYQGTGGLFAVISIGSGNRSTPLLGKQVNGAYIVNGETAALNTALTNDAIYNIYDKVVTDTDPAAVTLPTSPTLSNLYELTRENRELNATTAGTPPANLAANKENSNYKGWYYSFISPNLASNDTRRAIEKVQGDLIAIDNDLYVSTFDAEGVGTTESCGAGIYGNSRAHRFCMPYGQCLNGDIVANNTLVLGKGLLGITMGPGTSGADRRIITPLGSLPNGNKITGITYGAANKLIPQSWYEKN
ncbi:PilC/PilY family type IV pilus protein [Acinetobacter johnsonii]|uniref:PilC/PilY family type IV pilus protein n=1 Tax=Acinetobacter johnsonii TaxID=40214 RepID=UPI00244733BE|nr:PilC/PilY family type IV pilus protein [Acinetobacter johnsonii]MDH1362874.1 PilC/PilY family type IV pilus protein [Acinetobacter johnsonii]